MQLQRLGRPRFRDLLITATLAGTSLTAGAQVINQNFNSVTGAGGGPFFSGPGFLQIAGWDTGILGESAFAGTAGNARIGSASAIGLPTGGVGGTGAGQISVSGVTYDVISQNFNSVTGTGGGAFLVGNGNPDTNGFTAGWDTGITGEQAFGGTFGGATVVGGMSAAGVTPGGFARLDVDNINVSSGNWYAGLQFPIGALPGAISLANPSFDSGGAANLTSWQVFSAGFNVLAAPGGGFPTIVPRTGNGVLKMFGRFTGSYNVSGVYQEFAAQPGQVWEIDVWSRHITGDGIAGTQNFAVMRIEFYDAGNTLIGPQEVVVLNGASPLDTWIDNAPLQATAPAGAVRARGVLSFVQPGVGLFEGGAVHLDDAKFRLVSGPGAFTLANNSLTASIRGLANAGGETLGSVQLRIEDPDGNRLLFNRTATGSFATIGGPLDTAIETNSAGVPTPGAFDPGAASHVVVVAFNNDLIPWGTGGTLDVDSVALSNNNSNGSAWFSGLFFENLSIANGTTLNDLRLTADVKGSVVGGKYQLRLEAFKLGSAGLNETFETCTGTGGGVFLSDTQIIGGTTFGSDDDWDTGITGEGAFGGVFGQVDVLSGGGFSARGVTNGGAVGNGAGEIKVQDIIVGPGGGWYAGLSWGNQRLASTDLSQVVLSARVRGLPAQGGPYGVYELRIEDAQGDRMYFRAIADGTWQTIGGPLSTATAGPRLGGGGDGTFNLDSPSYNVALSFIDPESTWFFGGTLQIDNLFLTPIMTRDEIGRVTYHGVSNGQFQNIGGLLSQGETTLGDYNQDFSTVTGTSGGGLNNWDTGLTGEFAFFGTYGDAVVNGGGTARGCTTCGVNGSKAAQIVVENVPAATGGWFAGLVFPNVHADLSGDLSQLQLLAKIKGSANTGAGESLGTYLFRVEDNDGTSLQFTTTANGQFQTAGGALSTAQLVQIDAGDGVFNRNLGVYTITVAFVSTPTNWGPGGTLTIDDIFLSGVPLDAADTYTVTLTFEDEVATWGNGGTLTLDNLSLAPPVTCTGDLNGDNAVNLTDLAQLLSNFGLGSGATLSQGDLNGDGAVSLTDLATLLANFGTVCS